MRSGKFGLLVKYPAGQSPSSASELIRLPNGWYLNKKPIGGPTLNGVREQVRRLSTMYPSMKYGVMRIE